MNKTLNASLYSHEISALEDLKSEYNNTISDIVRRALNAAISNPTLLQRYLDGRSSQYQDFNPTIDGFNSNKFIFTLFDINTMKTYYRLHIDAGMLFLKIPVNTEVEFDSVQNRVRFNRHNCSNAVIYVDKIAEVQLYDEITGEIHDYRQFSKENWPKNFGLIIRMHSEEKVCLG